MCKKNLVVLGKIENFAAKQRTKNLKVLKLTRNSHRKKYNQIELVQYGVCVFNKLFYYGLK